MLEKILKEKSAIKYKQNIHFMCRRSKQTFSTQIQQLIILYMSTGQSNAGFIVKCEYIWKSKSKTISFTEKNMI